MAPRKKITVNPTRSSMSARADPPFQNPWIKPSERKEKPSIREAEERMC